MKYPTVVIAALLLCSVGVQASEKAGATNSLVEPMFREKPLTFWMDGFYKDEKVDQKLAIQAVHSIGVKGAPWMIRYFRAGLVSPACCLAVRRAFTYLPEDEKPKVEEMLPQWLHDSNPHVRANALALLSDDDVMVGRKFEKEFRQALHDPDPFVRDGAGVAAASRGIPNWR
jgi:hypothetical protein